MQVSLVVAVAAAVSACGSGDQGFGQAEPVSEAGSAGANAAAEVPVCVDDNTRQRLPEDDCRDESVAISHHSSWFWVGAAAVPLIGHAVAANARPAGRVRPIATQNSGGGSGSGGGGGGAGIWRGGSGSGSGSGADGAAEGDSVTRGGFGRSGGGSGGDAGGGGGSGGEGGGGHAGSVGG